MPRSLDVSGRALSTALPSAVWMNWDRRHTRTSQTVDVFALATLLLPTRRADRYDLTE